MSGAATEVEADRDGAAVRERARSRIRALILLLYVLRQLVVSFFFAMAAIWLIVLPTIAIQAIHKLGAVSVAALFSYLPLVVVELVPYLTPMAFLLAVVATYGRLAADRELVAIRMAGFHPGRLLVPGLLVAGLLSLWTNHLLANVTPEWKYVKSNFIRLSERKLFENIGQGRTELEFGDCSLKAERRYGNAFHGVLLNLTDESGERITVNASLAVLEVRDGTLFIHLRDASVFGGNVRFFGEEPFWSRSLDELFPFTPKDRYAYKYLSSAEMRAELDSGTLPESKVREFAFEVHRRDALSVTYLLFLLLGVPTGIVLRSSTQLGAFTGAAGYAILYYVLALRLGQELARGGYLPPSAAAWATNAIFLTIGSVFAFRCLWR